MSTIAAVSTPDATGGIAVIRVSGEKALEIADKVFTSVSGKKAVDMEGYTCAYGYASDGDERLDDCILTVFRAPHSYTGENTAEISCHGGIYVTRRILRTLINNGADNALPGEFTKRAFLNGKLDLTQAEAVMDVISAKSERELKMAEELRDGAAFKLADKCSGKLIKILGDLAAWADYPEEDIPAVEPENLKKVLEEVRKELSSLVQNYDAGRIIFDLMPEKFTLYSLQEAYEIVLGEKLTTPNFRRKIAPFVIETDETITGVGHRPAKLFKRNLEAFYE